MNHPSDDPETCCPSCNGHGVTAPSNVKGGTDQIHNGATPDEARARAAAWVREQARKAGT